MRHKKIIVLIIILAILGGAYAWFFVYNKAHVNYQLEEAVYSGQADEFLQIAKQNESAFLEKYTNQAVELSGEVTSLESSSFSLGEGTYCTLDSAHTMLPLLNSNVSLKGRVVGIDEDLLTEELIILMDQCVIMD